MKILWVVISQFALLSSASLGIEPRVSESLTAQQDRIWGTFAKQSSTPVRFSIHGWSASSRYVSLRSLTDINFLECRGSC